MKKSHVIILYGPIAVGKLTIGKLLAKKLGYKLTHNHLTNDLVWSVFERGTKAAHEVTEKMRYDFYETCVKYGNNLVITHAFSHNWVSLTGLSDPTYLKTLGKKLEKAGAEVLFVHLQADPKELLIRVKNESRKEFRKLTKPSILKELSKTKDWTTSAPVKNNLVINNTNLKPTQVVQQILKHLQK